MRSKAYWGYSPQFLEQAAPELTVTEDDITDGNVSVAEVGDRLVGVSVLELAYPAELVALFVEPDVIGQGVGRALLDHALAHAESAGITSLLIESDPNAEPFYRAQGAQEIGRRTSPTTGRDLALLRLPVGGGALSRHQ
jgi:GNAT superfamily N-acetyltransferase